MKGIKLLKNIKSSPFKQYNIYNQSLLFKSLSVKNQNSKFAKEEETESSLLRQFDNINTNQKDKLEDRKLIIRDFISQRENIIFIKNDVFETKLRQGQFIIINDKHYAQILSLEKNKSTAIVYSKFNLKKENVNSINLVSESEIDLIHKVNLSSSSYSISPSITKLYQKRNLVNKMLSTGQLLIDYINPQYIGNFILMQGSPFLGQEKINTINN
jgi:hypothetical protein